MKKTNKNDSLCFSIHNQLHSVYPISSWCDGGSSSNSDDDTMVHSLFDLDDTSIFYKKQNKRTLHEINSWEILNLLLKQQWN